ncbi:MAG: prepilin-type N-terminal cleavage/methylation domain-containing protein [Candidatus Riflebacteria bacterium]|nr:prepilin-type N-terminal cleavage/methylation domain-containing protein [Candidatus Riflebacteria bacterium]
MNQKAATRAFTLIEVVIVCAILMLILIPTYRILSHGGRSALKGVQRNNVVMQGQQILSQLKLDLTLSCFIFVNDKSHSISDIFTETTTGSDVTISFFTFNGDEYANKVLPTSSGPESYRRMNKVEYVLKSRPGSVFKTLERVLQLHPKIGGGRKSRVLSDKVNFFEIRPETINSAGYSRSFFRITLQLFDQDDNASGNVGKQFIADFMETANPTILNSIINNPGLNRNWYTDPHNIE